MTSRLYQFANGIVFCISYQCVINNYFNFTKMAVTFSEIINNEKPVLVDFYADWCGPCKMMKPILENVKKQVGDQAIIIKVNVDKNQATASAYNVSSIPTLMIFKKGEMVWRQAGVAQTQQLVAQLGNFMD
jgi:thioredoxin 1